MIKCHAVVYIYGSCRKAQKCKKNSLTTLINGAAVIRIFDTMQELPIIVACFDSDKEFAKIDSMVNESTIPTMIRLARLFCLELANLYQTAW